jgi:Ca-activated chloride channel family protein
MKNKLTVIMILFMTTLVGCDNQKSSNQTLVTNDPNALHILAGSELKDMEVILQEASKEIGVPISVEYSGTMDGVDRIKSGQKYDVGWFSQSKYFYDTDENAKKIKQSEKVMFSPVVIGMRQASYSRSGLDTMKQITWSNVYDLVTKKNFQYAMTDPSASNTGYSALMGVAYSTANKTEALTARDINDNKMKSFFKGHLVNAGSSGWLVQAFKQSNVDFMVNYESVILQYNKDNPNDQLKVIYPFEGIVTADYPVLLLNKDKSIEYKKLIDFLKKEKIQKEIVDITNRRVRDTKIMQNINVFPKQLLIEMPFNPDSKLSDSLLSAYYQEYKKPAAVVFVLDVSGSMDREEDLFGKQESRIDLVKDAMNDLSVGNSEKSKFAHFRNREKIWLIPFGSDVKDIKNFELNGNESNNQTIKKQINDYVQNLHPQDGTSLFSAIKTANDLLEKEKQSSPDYQYSIVVLTDGDSNEGMSAVEYADSMRFKGMANQIRVFPILFGEGNQNDLSMISKLTGGKVFNGKNKNLSDVFKEIRSYQ